MEVVEIIEKRIKKLSQPDKHEILDGYIHEDWIQHEVGSSEDCPNCIRINELERLLEELQKPETETERKQRVRELRQEQRRRKENA